MSQKVTVDFEGLSIEMEAKCDVALHSLCKIDKVLTKIHKNASMLITDKVNEYEEYLVSSKNKVEKLINDLKKKLEEYNKLKLVTIDTDTYYNHTEDNINLYNKYKEINVDIRKQLDKLVKTSNELTGSKVEIIDQMIDEGLLNLGDNVYNILSNNKLDINDDILVEINNIDDISLRELAYISYLDKSNKDKSFAELLNLAKIKYDELLDKKMPKVVEECKEELKVKGISSDKIDSVKDIDELNILTNSLITDERIRKETLLVIIKAIKKRGFIVDTKKNLKIDKTTNIAKLLALKASGQKAMFEIDLDGKFMYHFDGYEGQACKNDITQFLEDLKNIYDINILHEEISWSNPDKIQTQKYQYVNKNKGRT